MMKVLSHFDVGVKLVFCLVVGAVCAGPQQVKAQVEAAVESPLNGCSGRESTRVQGDHWQSDNGPQFESWFVVVVRR